MLSSIPASFLLLYCKLLYLSHLVEELQSSIQCCFWVITASQHLIVHVGRKQSSWGGWYKSWHTEKVTKQTVQYVSCNLLWPRGTPDRQFPIECLQLLRLLNMTKFTKSERHLESIYFHSERSTRGASSRKRFNLHVRTCMTRINVD